MASVHDPPISTWTITGLVVVIGIIDVLATRVVPEPAGVPVKIGILIALVGWAHGWLGLSWDELGLGRAHLPAGLRWGGAVALIIAAGLTVFVLVPATRSFFESSDVAADSTTRRVLMPLVIIPLGTALFEETIFRGVLLGVLLRSSTRRTAWVVSSVLFGLWHLPPALSNANGKGAAAAVGTVIGTIAITTVAGLAFGYLRLRSGSVVAPLLAHTATNSFAYVAAVAVLHL